MTEIDNKSGERGTVHQKVRVKNLTFGGQFFCFLKKELVFFMTLCYNENSRTFVQRGCMSDKLKKIKRNMQPAGFQHIVRSASQEL